jgi:hypothetical protein
MAITIDFDDITYIICKHLLECGYTHSAFCLEKEAKLDPRILKDKNIPPGYLVHNLEKALVLGRMETHVHLDELHECTKPYDLLVEHACEITEKVIKEREAAYKEIIQSNVSERIEKTSAYTQSQKLTKGKSEPNGANGQTPGVQSQPNLAYQTSQLSQYSMPNPGNYGVAKESNFADTKNGDSELVFNIEPPRERALTRKKFPITNDGHVRIVDTFINSDKEKYI